MTAHDEVVGLVSDLIRIDSTNTGDDDTTVGEQRAADYVEAALSEVGYDVERVESDRPGRHSLVTRLTGADPARGALLVHAHLDAVPADPSEWSVHPLSGEVHDGYIWGRGAVDMKDMVGMTLALARELARTGTVPPRDIVFAFLADEEAGGRHGAQWIVDHRPDLLHGVTEAIGELGGFSITVRDGVRAYLVQTAEKGIRWLTLRAFGPPGHGSMLHERNALAELATAVATLGAHRFPVTLTPPVRELLAGISEISGIDFPEDDLDAAVAKLGNISRMIGATLRDTATPTMFRSGYKSNVVPSVAEAAVDCRILPGRHEAFDAELAELLGPRIERTWHEQMPVSTTFDGHLVDAMSAAIVAEDPSAAVLPFMVSGGTDAKRFAQLGIRCFGFTPLRLPADLDFTALFHGIDERVPVDALHFGVDVLRRLLATC